MVQMPDETTISPSMSTAVKAEARTELSDHPTARRMVEAAKAILVSDGFPGLTLEAVAAEAGVNKASTRYYFGGKRGLIDAVIREIVLDECADSQADVAEDATPEERVDAFIANARRIAGHAEAFGGFFEILPHAVKDDEFRQHFVELYRSWFEWNLEWLGLSARDDLSEERRRALCMLMAAVVDGLAVQATIFQPDYDATGSLELYRGMLLEIARGQTSD